MAGSPWGFLPLRHAHPAPPAIHQVYFGFSCPGTDICRSFHSSGFLFSVVICLSPQLGGGVGDDGQRFALLSAFFYASKESSQYQELARIFVGVQSRSCVLLCDPMDCSTPGFPILHYLPEFAQTHVNWVGDAIQPSHLLPPSSPPIFDLSQHQGLL